MSQGDIPIPPVVGDVPQYVIDFYNNLKNEFALSSQGAPVTKSDLDTAVNTIMSKISDFADAVNANLAQVQSGIANLDAQILAFQNSPGTLSATDQAALDGIVASSAALASAANAVVPVVPPTT